MAKWITVTDAGLSLTVGYFTTFIAWSEIDAISVYKVDRFTYDSVCLAFRCGECWHACDEEDHGFSDLFSAIQRHFPSVDPKWYDRVLQPAFESDERVLFEREPSDASH